MEAISAPRPHAVRIPRPRRFLAALSDERLVEHIRRGEPAAFEVLYDRHSAGILGFCRHMLGSAADAEDAVQHTFIAAHADIGRHGDRDLHVKAWLYAIARNRCLSMLRARREHPVADDIEVVSDHLDHDVAQREDLRSLLEDVAKLPDDQREALVLAEVGDLSHEDISKVLDCEASKVKSLVFQARTALIDRRLARDTPCDEIREQLATLRGGALRRSHLRHHLDGCPGCREYRDEVRRQRAMLAVALPVLPSTLLRANVLGAVGVGGGSAAIGTAGAGTGIGVATQASLAKLGIAAAIVAGAGGGAAIVTHGGLPLLHHSHSSAATTPAGRAKAAAAAQHRGTTHAAVTTGGSTASTKQAAAGSATSGAHHHHGRSASGTNHGFTPTTGASNGAAARKFAATRGQGKHLGITKTHAAKGSQPTRTRPAHVKHVAAPRVNAHPSPKAQVHREQPATKTKTTPAPSTKQGPAPTSTTESSVPPPAGSNGLTGGSGSRTLTTGG